MLGFLRKKKKVPVAKLGEENAFYYNEELKCWVERGKEAAAAKQAVLAPPPKIDPVKTEPKAKLTGPGSKYVDTGFGRPGGESPKSPLVPTLAVSRTPPPGVNLFVPQKPAEPEPEDGDSGLKVDSDSNLVNGGVDGDAGNKEGEDFGGSASPDDPAASNTSPLSMNESNTDGGDGFGGVSSSGGFSGMKMNDPLSEVLGGIGQIIPNGDIPENVPERDAHLGEGDPLSEVFGGKNSQNPAGISKLSDPLDDVFGGGEMNGEVLDPEAQSPVAENAESKTVDAFGGADYFSNDPLPDPLVDVSKNEYDGMLADEVKPEERGTQGVGQNYAEWGWTDEQTQEFYGWLTQHYGESWHSWTTEEWDNFWVYYQGGCQDPNFQQKPEPTENETHREGGEGEVAGEQTGENAMESFGSIQYSPQENGNATAEPKYVEFHGGKATVEGEVLHGLSNLGLGNIEMDGLTLQGEPVTLGGESPAPPDEPKEDLEGAERIVGSEFVALEQKEQSSPVETAGKVVASEQLATPLEDTKLMGSLPWSDGDSAASPKASIASQKSAASDETTNGEIVLADSDYAHLGGFFMQLNALLDKLDAKEGDIMSQKTECQEQLMLLLKSMRKGNGVKSVLEDKMWGKGKVDLAGLEAQLDEKSKKIKELEGRLAQSASGADNRINGLKAELQERDARVGDLNAQLDTLKNELESTRQTVEGVSVERDSEIESLKADLDTRLAEIRLLNETVHELQSGTTTNAADTQKLENELEMARRRIEELEAGQEIVKGPSEGELATALGLAELQISAMSEKLVGHGVDVKLMVSALLGEYVEGV